MVSPDELSLTTARKQWRIQKNAAAHAHAAMIPNELFEQAELDGAFSGGIDIFDYLIHSLRRETEQPIVM